MLCRGCGWRFETAGCVALVSVSGGHAVRDSRDPHGPRLHFGPDALDPLFVSL
ncbi:DUF397 domain-containing protein [Actinokineospora spheciospongiae]|uniref:DUF397 domain-containing protein n=1 Tax=Actinokineospora spheciospongiae TaxID=909613 RepID=UPI000A02B344